MTYVTITSVRYEDAEELIQANLESRECHFPWTEPFTTRKGFEDWFGRIVTGPNLGFVAREQHAGAIVGVVNVNEVVWGAFRSGYLGYYGRAGWLRRGLMTEAVRQVTAHVFEHVGLHRLEANIQPANSASIALVRRLGFRSEGFSPRYLRIGGVWCDHERWALLADDPA